MFKSKGLLAILLLFAADCLHCFLGGNATKITRHYAKMLNNTVFDAFDGI